MSCFGRKIPRFALITRPVKVFSSSQLLKLLVSSIMKTVLATKGNQPAVIMKLTQHV